MTSFTARDLALLLPDDVGDAFSLRHTKKDETQKYEAPKPRIDPTKKVGRYWAGKAVVEANSDDDDDAAEEFEALASSRVTQSSEVPLTIPADDSRLRRLQAKQQQSSQSSVPERRRRVIEAEVIVANEKDDSTPFQGYSEGDILAGEDFEDQEQDIQEQNEEEEMELRRSRVRERMSAPSSEPPATSSSTDRPPLKTPQQQSESEYETDEYTSESEEEEEEEEETLLKPVFVPKSKRETIAEQERKAAEEDEKWAQQAAELEARKLQTRTMVAEGIKRQEELKEMDNTDADSDAGLPDDTDGLDEALEYEEWKVREMTRLKRDFLEREEMEREKAEVSRRRGLTDEERMREDEAAGRFDEKEKKKWRFMQKYYHKGVFYMDESSLKASQNDARKKDYDAPTLEDHVNREALPKVLQVKNFGKRGRTKWTHLVAEDTTNWENPWFQKSDLRDKYNQKMAGVGDINIGNRKRSKNS